MKNLLIISMLLMAACSEPMTESHDLQTQAKIVKPGCFADRMTVYQISFGQGMVHSLGTEYRISYKNTFLYACNLPTSFKVDSLRIDFSAEVKEMRDHEFWIGEPCELSMIR